MRQRFSTVLVLTVLLGGTLIAGGCDFQRVDEGETMPLARVLEDLATADTPAKAETAIEHLFQKTEIGVAYKAGLYDGYSFKDEELEALAEAHAAYIRQAREGNDTGSSTPTLSSVYEEVLEGDQRRTTLDVAFHLNRRVEATLDRTLEILDVSARAAMADQEQAGNALLLSITTDALGTAPGLSEIAADRRLSPVQRVAFGIWLHKNGPAIKGNQSSSMDDSNDLCPAQYPILVSKYEWNGSDYIFEKPTGNESLVTIDESSTDLSGSWTSLIGIDAVVTKGGTDREVITSASTDPNNDIFDFGFSGTFDNTGLEQNGNAVSISHIEFCREKDETTTCIEECAERLNVCLLNAATPQEEQICQDEYVACDAACHDQGSAG